MTDCIHNDNSDLVDCTTELLAARKEVMRLRTENAELRVMLTNAVTETAGAIDDLFMDAVQSDLEHGIKWLNENAAKEFERRHPALCRFPAELRAKYMPQDSNNPSTTLGATRATLTNPKGNTDD